MTKREISYILPSGDPTSDEEFCVRNMNYTDWKSLKSDITRMTPLRIDIGAIFDGDVKNNKNKVDGLTINPVEREFVIDIDLTDYDHIRTCCSGKRLCDKCWTYVKAAHKVLKHILDKSFGFKHILWVFSGRRGIHAWVCDESARFMSKKVRKAVTEFLNFTLSNDMVNFLVKPELINKKNKYTLLFEAYEILKQYRGFLLEEQKILERENVVNMIFSVTERYIERDLTDAEKAQFKSKRNGHSKLELLKNIIEKCESEEDKEGKHEKGDMFVVEFILGYLYPKIDSHVSAQVNHLLKAPFNIHHSTMNVSLPIMDIDKFSIENCLSVKSLLAKMKETKKNPIQPEIDFFKKFCDKCENK